MIGRWQGKGHSCQDKSCTSLNNKLGDTYLGAAEAHHWTRARGKTKIHFCINDRENAAKPTFTFSHCFTNLFLFLLSLTPFPFAQGELSAYSLSTHSHTSSTYDQQAKVKHGLPRQALLTFLLCVLTWFINRNLILHSQFLIPIT